MYILIISEARPLYLVSEKIKPPPPKKKSRNKISLPPSSQGNFWSRVCNVTYVSITIIVMQHLRVQLKYENTGDY